MAKSYCITTRRPGRPRKIGTEEEKNEARKKQKREYEARVRKAKKNDLPPQYIHVRIVFKADQRFFSLLTGQQVDKISHLLTVRKRLKLLRWKDSQNPNIIVKMDITSDLLRILNINQIEFLVESLGPGNYNKLLRKYTSSDIKDLCNKIGII